jgi:hypothetical protein
LFFWFWHLSSFFGVLVILADLEGGRKEIILLGVFLGGKRWVERKGERREERESAEAQRGLWYFRVDGDL